MSAGRVRAKPSRTAVVAALEDDYVSPDDNLHDGGRAVLFREFVEGVVRVAAEKFALDEDSPTLGARVVKLMQGHVLPYAMKEAASLDDGFDQKLRAASPALVDVRKRMGGVFNYYARQDVSLSGGTKDSTLNLREFLLLLNDIGAIGQDYSVKTAMRAFISANFVSEAASMESGEIDPDNLDTEMIEEEFFDAVCRVADAKSTAGGDLAERIIGFVEGEGFARAKSSKGSGGHRAVMT